MASTMRASAQRDGVAAQLGAEGEGVSQIQAQQAQLAQQAASAQQQLMASMPGGVRAACPAMGYPAAYSAAGGPWGALQPGGWGSWGSPGGSSTPYYG